jgi:Ca2+-binding EF-hand superfamily protein
MSRRCSEYLVRTLQFERCRNSFHNIWFADITRAGAIDFERFLQALAGPMNKQRKDIVDLAFNVLDQDGSGQVDMSDMIKIYNVNSHPDFKSGKKTKEQILREMMDVFDVGGEKDGIISRQEFRNYYQQISAGIDNDNMFELMVRNAWHISGGVGQAANTANRRVLVTRADGTQGVEEIKSDLGLDSRDKAGAISRLQKQGVTAANIDFYGGMEDKNTKYRPGSAAPTVGRGGARAVGSGPAMSVAGAGVGGAASRNAQSYAPAMMAAPGRGDQSMPPGPDDDADDMNPLLRKFKERIVARGSHGIVGLQRKFKIMDDDGSKSLNMAEFKKAIKETVPEFTENDIGTLFRLFGG